MLKYIEPSLKKIFHICTPQRIVEMPFAETLKGC